MALVGVVELLRTVHGDPLAFLTERTLASLSNFLGGRDLALGHLGLAEWDPLPVAERIEQHYGDKTMPWRNWREIVEHHAHDRWDAFLQFLTLASLWEDAPPPAPPVAAEPPPPASLVDQIAARPEMYLGAKSIFALADFLRGYAHTLAAVGRDPVELERFFATMQGESDRPWFKRLRFDATSDDEAFDRFVERWRARLL